MKLILIYFRWRMKSFLNGIIIYFYEYNMTHDEKKQHNVIMKTFIKNLWYFVLAFFIFHDNYANRRLWCCSTSVTSLPPTHPHTYLMPLCLSQNLLTYITLFKPTMQNQLTDIESTWVKIPSKQHLVPFILSNSIVPIVPMYVWPTMNLTVVFLFFFLSNLQIYVLVYQ